MDVNLPSEDNKLEVRSYFLMVSLVPKTLPNCNMYGKIGYTRDGFLPLIVYHTYNLDSYTILLSQAMGLLYTYTFHYHSTYIQVVCRVFAIAILS